MNRFGNSAKKEVVAEPAEANAETGAGQEPPAPFSAVAWTGDFAVPAETELLVHATNLGHRSNNVRLPLDIETLRPDLFVADVAVGSPQTWLLDEAVQRGCKTADGLTMFVHQVAIGFRQWTGVDPDRQVLREAVEEFWEL
jgi:shikimate dehydrogenase